MHDTNQQRPQSELRQGAAAEISGLVRAQIRGILSYSLISDTLLTQKINVCICSSGERSVVASLLLGYSWCRDSSHIAKHSPLFAFPKLESQTDDLQHARPSVLYTMVLMHDCLKPNIGVMRLFSALEEDQAHIQAKYVFPEILNVSMRYKLAGKWLTR